MGSRNGKVGVASYGTIYNRPDAVLGEGFIGEDLTGLFNLASITSSMLDGMNLSRLTSCWLYHIDVGVPFVKRSIVCSQSPTWSSNSCPKTVRPRLKA